MLSASGTRPSRRADSCDRPRPTSRGDHRCNTILQTSEITGMYPSNLHYTKEHEWVRVEQDIGVVGITDHAQKELGDIVYIELPRVGSTVEQGKSLGSVESVKAVSDIYAPVSGEVIEVNDM